jgi:superfamily II DNA or RNA helicase
LKIVDNKALLLRLRHPQKVTTVIPKSKELADNNVLVHWGLDEVQVLRNLNIKAPSPIKERYEWTGKYKPFDHQKDTAAFLTLNQKSFCFNEQGTGKTASAIWAADFLIKQGRIRRVLVICPLSIMDSAWRNDLFTFAMHRSVSVAYGSAKKRSEIIQSKSDFVIINYDGVEIVRDAIANGGFDLIIVDEATHYKNPQTKRWKILQSLLKPQSLPQKNRSRLPMPQLT